MLITNLPDIKDREYEILGMVEGSAVHAKNFGRDMMAGLKNFVGGELKGYTEMVEDAKRNSFAKMEKQADMLQADAVINVKYELTNLQTGSSLVVNVTGTAIRFK